MSWFSTQAPPLPTEKDKNNALQQLLKKIGELTHPHGITEGDIEIYSKKIQI